MRHDLPIGTIRADFHKHSGPLYNALCQAGEVERLKRVSQLGLISRVFHGAHHPRWEYVAVTIKLIELAKSHVSSVALSSNVDVGGEKVSKTELAKIWTLLLATGHLPWTFVAEREFLYHLKRSRRLKAQFLAGLPTERLRTVAKRILRTENPYRAHYLIAMYRMASWARNQPAADAARLKAFWEQCLLLYIDPPADDVKLVRLIEVFRRIRTLAFLCLDLSYVPRILEFDLRDILIDPAKLHDFLGDDSDNGSRLLQAAQNFVTEEIYLSSKVIASSETPALKLRQALQKEPEQNIETLLQKLTSGAYQRSINSERKNVSLVLRLPFRAEGPLARFFFYPQTVFQEEKSLDRLLGSSIAHSRVWPLYDRLQKHVCIFFRRRLSQRDRLREQGRICNAITSYMIAEMKGLGRTVVKLKPFDAQRLIFSKPATAFVEHSIRHTSRFPGRIFFRHHPSIWAPDTVVCASKAEALRHVSEAIRRHKSAVHAQRRGELIALRAAIKQSEGRSYFIVLASVFLVDEDGTDLGEIDGLFLSKYYSRFRIHYVEAKDKMKRAPSQIDSQLKKLIYDKLRIRLGMHCTFSAMAGGRGVPRYEVATVELPISARRLPHPRSR